MDQKGKGFQEVGLYNLYHIISQITGTIWNACITQQNLAAFNMLDQLEWLGYEIAEGIPADGKREGLILTSYFAISSWQQYIRVYCQLATPG